MSETRHWIFLRGLVRGRGHWADFPEKFQKKFPQDTFEMLDLPGNGELSEQDSPWTLREYVESLRSRAEALPQGKRVHLLALSLGGMIAVEWMKHYPHEIAKIYLVCTSAGNRAHFYERFRLENYWKFLPLVKAHTPAQYEEKLMSVIANNEDRRRQVLPALIAYSNAHPMRLQNFARQLIAAAQSRFPPKAPGPVVLIGSHGDRLVSPHCTLKIAKAWGLPSRMHPNAGHDIPIDDPDWLLEQLA